MSVPTLSRHLAEQKHLAGPVEICSGRGPDACEELRDEDRHDDPE